MKTSGLCFHPWWRWKNPRRAQSHPSPADGKLMANPRHTAHSLTPHSKHIIQSRTFISRKKDVCYWWHCSYFRPKRFRKPGEKLSVGYRHLLSWHRTPVRSTRWGQISSKNQSTSTYELFVIYMLLVKMLFHQNTQMNGNLKRWCSYDIYQQGQQDYAN